MASTTANEAEIVKSTAKESPPTLHQAVANLAIAYMEEMRDDTPESQHDHPAENLELAPSATTELNIREIVSEVARTHSISGASHSPPVKTESKASDSKSKASKKSKEEASSQQHYPFPTHAVTNDEIISRFDSIMVSDTNDTESISELETIIEARGVVSSLKTELMNWMPNTGCCISPSSKFDVTEEINVDVVKTDSVEEGVVVVYGVGVEASADEEAPINEENTEENSVISRPEYSDNASADFPEPEVDKFKASVSVGSEGSAFKPSISVETDLTEPAKNFGLAIAIETEASTSVKTKADESLCQTDEETKESSSSDSVKSAPVTFEPEKFPEEAIATPAASEESVKEVSRCTSPSIDTEGSATSAEVAALLAIIRNESLEDEVRCTSPSIDTEGSVISAQIGAHLTIIKNESHVASVEEKDLVVPEGSVMSEVSVYKDESVSAGDETVNEKKMNVVIDENDVTTSKEVKLNSVGKAVTVKSSDDVEAEAPTPVDTEPTPQTNIESDISKPTGKAIAQFAVVETVEAHSDKPTPTVDTRSPLILTLTAGSPPTESILSPHSEASRLTDITSNQTHTPMPANKSVHWSMSLDALSLEGDFLACDSSKSVSSASVMTRESDYPPTPTNATSVTEVYYREIAKEGRSGQLGDLTSTWVAKIKKDWKCIESANFAKMRDSFVSWTESGACFTDTTLASQLSLDIVQDGSDSAIERRDTTKSAAISNVASLAIEESAQCTSETATATVKNSAPPVTENIEQCGSSPVTEAATQYSCEQVKPALQDNVAEPISPDTRVRTATATEHLHEDVYNATEHLHEDVYKERDYLREWKLNAEETMKCQDTVTCVLREQKLSLVKQCNELERAIKDLKEWKFQASDKMKSQSTQLADLTVQKAGLVKQCEQNQESIQELSNWKFAAERGLAIREAEVEQIKIKNATLSEENQERREAIDALTEWKIESMETMKNQLAELECAQSKISTLTTQCKTYQDSVRELTSWKSDNEPVMQNHVAELKRLNDENAALVSKCDDQQISMDRLSRWKMNAEEEMKQQLAKLKLFEKQVSELTSESNQQNEFTEQLEKWKSDAEDTIKKQLSTIDELSKWKKTASEQSTEMTGKIESLEKENADLTKQCSEYKASIEELTTAKLNAEETQRSQLAEIETLTAQLEAGLNDEDRTTLEELTKWKAEAEATMKEKETELSELQSHYLIFGKQCNEQKELLQQREKEILSLTKEINAATKMIKGLEKDKLAHATKIMSYKDTIQSQTDEMAELKAEIAKLKERLESEDQPHKQEIVAMKMAHHKELMVLKTERHMLASKIQKLVNKNEDLTSKVTNLNVEMDELESKYQHEKEGNDSSKIAVKKLEKALKVRESCRG